MPEVWIIEPLRRSLDSKAAREHFPRRGLENKMLSVRGGGTAQGSFVSAQFHRSQQSVMPLARGPRACTRNYCYAYRDATEKRRREERRGEFSGKKERHKGARHRFEGNVEGEFSLGKERHVPRTRDSRQRRNFDRHFDFADENPNLRILPRLPPRTVRFSDLSPLFSRQPVSRLCIIYGSTDPRRTKPILPPRERTAAARRGNLFDTLYAKSRHPAAIWPPSPPKTTSSIT